MQNAISSVLSVFRRIFAAAMTTEELEVRLGKRPSADRRITILAVTQRKQDRDLLARVAANQQWALHVAGTCKEASQILEDCQTQILFLGRGLPGAHWTDVLQMMIASGQSMYIILGSKGVDDHLWHELIRWGGHDLLPTPLTEEAVLRAVRFAWSYWKRAMMVPPACAR